VEETSSTIGIEEVRTVDSPPLRGKAIQTQIVIDTPTILSDVIRLSINIVYYRLNP